jgi:phospholipid transport system transporter-binding protein
VRIETGDLGMGNAAEVVATGVAAIERGEAEFDLSGVARCDSSAVAVLLEWQRAAQAKGLTLKVTGAPRGLISLASVYGVEGLLPAVTPGG